MSRPALDCYTQPIPHQEGSAMTSKAFNDFHASCFCNSVYSVRDGLDIRALLALEGTERAEAARLVL